MVGGSNVKSKMMLPEKEIFSSVLHGLDPRPVKSFHGLHEGFNAEGQAEPHCQHGPITNEPLCQLSRVSRCNTT